MSDPLGAYFEAQSSLDLSVFIPCLNEEKNVVGAILKTVEACQSLGLSYEILIFDDGSTDATSAVVEKFRAERPELPVALYRQEKNRGIAANFIDGAFLAKGRFYRCVAGDDYEKLEAHMAILRAIGTADMIVPVYVRVDNRGALRTLVSRTFTLFVNLVSGFRVGYYNGFAVFRRWHVMRYNVEGTGFGFQAELITRLLLDGKSYREIPLTATYNGISRAFTFKNFVSVSYSLFKILMRRLRIVLFD